MEKINELLLVEDNEADSRLFMRVLSKKESVKVHRVKDGVEALLYLEESCCQRDEFPKLILLDLKMPRMNGLEFLSRIRRQKQLKNLPVVIFSSSCQEKDLQQAYKLGANSYLVKPFDYKQLHYVVEKVTDYWFALNKQPENCSSYITQNFF